jgi:hypothetical protein
MLKTRNIFTCRKAVLQLAAKSINLFEILLLSNAENCCEIFAIIAKLQSWLDVKCSRSQRRHSSVSDIFQFLFEKNIFFSLFNSCRGGQLHGTTFKRATS